jgi:exopolysaccharide biosynthesis protein
MNTTKTNNKIYLILLLHIKLLISFTTVSHGVLYKNIVQKKPGLSIHVLLVDSKLVNIQIGLAKNQSLSAEKTSEIASRHNAIAAINGGFYEFGSKNKFGNMLTHILDWLGYNEYETYPSYALKINNKFYSLSHIFTGAIAWNNQDQSPIFGITKNNINLIINGHNYSVKELNKPNPDGPTVYLEGYDKTSPALNKRFDEIVIQENRILQIIEKSNGKTKIPKNGWIYVVPKDNKITDALKKDDQAILEIISDEKVDFREIANTPKLGLKDNLLASTPLLIMNSQINSQIEEQTSNFYIKKHPRSAVGLLQNGNWVFVVVDGRQKHSVGFTLIELAKFMLDLGCTHALNLDGGGSSTMVIKNQIVNLPSGKKFSLFKNERPVSNALLITPKPA